MHNAYSCSWSALSVSGGGAVSGRPVARACAVRLQAFLGQMDAIITSGDSKSRFVDYEYMAYKLQTQPSMTYVACTLDTGSCGLMTESPPLGTRLNENGAMLLSRAGDGGREGGRDGGSE